mmetsp:Transcript_16658/g.27565  ORF Transcript_16658/g.27565 Transcript_16658/m.27565 type:complete len:479 (-) Transcript_16658:92-1528(-)
MWTSAIMSEADLVPEHARLSWLAGEADDEHEMARRLVSLLANEKAIACLNHLYSELSSRLRTTSKHRFRSSKIRSRVLAAQLTEVGLASQQLKSGQDGEIQGILNIYRELALPKSLPSRPSTSEAGSQSESAGIDQSLQCDGTPSVDVAVQSDVLGIENAECQSDVNLCDRSSQSVVLETDSVECQWEGSPIIEVPELSSSYVDSEPADERRPDLVDETFLRITALEEELSTLQWSSMSHIAQLEAQLATASAQLVSSEAVVLSLREEVNAQAQRPAVSDAAEKEARDIVAQILKKAGQISPRKDLLVDVALLQHSQKEKEILAELLKSEQEERASQRKAMDLERKQLSDQVKALQQELERMSISSPLADDYVSKASPTDSTVLDQVRYALRFSLPSRMKPSTTPTSSGTATPLETGHPYIQARIVTRSVASVTGRSLPTAVHNSPSSSGSLTPSNGSWKQPPAKPSPAPIGLGALLC